VTSATLVQPPRSSTAARRRALPLAERSTVTAL
jgi:hypothetical protein